MKLFSKASYDSANFYSYDLQAKSTEFRLGFKLVNDMYVKCYYTYKETKPEEDLMSIDGWDTFTAQKLDL